MGNSPHRAGISLHVHAGGKGCGKPVHAGTAGSLNSFILQPANTSNIDEDTPGLWTMAILNDPTSGTSPPKPLLHRYCLRHGSGHSLPIPTQPSTFTWEPSRNCYSALSCFHHGRHRPANAVVFIARYALVPVTLLPLTYSWAQ